MIVRGGQTFFKHFFFGFIMNNLNQINKVGYFVTTLRFPQRQLENRVQCFEEVQRKSGLSFVTSIKVLKEVTVPSFEEVQKKPAGFF